MDPNSVKSTLSNLAFGNVMAAAASDYKKFCISVEEMGLVGYLDAVDDDWELLAQEKTLASSSNHEEVYLDELMDDPQLEKLHADWIAALNADTSLYIPQGILQMQAKLLSLPNAHTSLTMDKHLKALAAKHQDTKFIKRDAENVPFFIAKLAFKTLPCVILFRVALFPQGEGETRILRGHS